MQTLVSSESVAIIILIYYSIISNYINILIYYYFWSRLGLEICQT